MMGIFRSCGGCLDTLIITYSLGVCSLRDLRGFDREVMSEVGREVMGLGVSHGYVNVGWAWGSSSSPR
eukprot:2547911-Prymnesium_polylepis.1